VNYTVITIPGCTRCEGVLEKLRGGGNRVLQLDMVEIRTQLAIQNQEFPVVYADGGIIDAKDVLELGNGKKEK